MVIDQLIVTFTLLIFLLSLMIIKKRYFLTLQNNITLSNTIKKMTYSMINKKEEKEELNNDNINQMDLLERC